MKSRRELVSLVMTNKFKQGKRRGYAIMLYIADRGGYVIADNISNKRSAQQLLHELYQSLKLNEDVWDFCRHVADIHQVSTESSGQ